MKGMPKEEAINTLKLHWDVLAPTTRRDLLWSLMGHHVSDIEIAETIGRDIEIVREARKVKHG